MEALEELAINLEQQKQEVNTLKQDNSGLHDEISQTKQEQIKLGTEVDEVILQSVRKQQRLHNASFFSFMSAS